MRRFLLNTVTWVLIASGAFFFVAGGMDYVESKRAQEAIAAQWNAGQSANVPVPDHSNYAQIPPESSRESDTPDRVESPGIMATPHPGAAVARLSIPRLHAVLYVVEGDDNNDLKRGPGHLIGTAMPGDPGNCVIAGHRDTHFRVLKNIQDGDEILLTRDGQTWRYRVNELSIVSPDNLSPLQPSHTPVLHLITCYPFYYLGSAPKRFVVSARLENEPLRASR